MEQEESGGVTVGTSKESEGGNMVIGDQYPMTQWSVKESRLVPLENYSTKLT